MNDPLDAYTALSASASASAVLSALPRAQIDTRAKRKLAQLILDDLRAALLDSTISRLAPADAPHALVALKSIGSTPDVARVLASPENLRCLLRLSTKIDSAQQNDALRCIANTMLLDESARVTLVSPEVDGGNACLDLLQKSSIEHVFLAARILFLCTASLSSAAPFIQWLVEHKRTSSGTAIDVIVAKIDDLSDLIKDGSSAVKDAITDLLKLTFNLCVHYPKLVDCEIQTPEAAYADHKVMGDYWSARLDSLLSPLLRAFHVNPPSSHPLETPLPHIIHSLIIIPVLPSNRNTWFGKHRFASIPSDSSSSSSLASNHSLPSAFKETKSRLFECASSVLSAGRRSLSRSSTSRSPTPVLQDSALRAYELLDTALAYYMPGDIGSDDPSIKARLPEGESFDDLLSPLGILLTRFCLGDDDAKVRIRNWFIPPNLDRSIPLESRPDILGRCLRLLQSLCHTRLNRVCGELFFAMCDCDAQTMSGYLGYGNVAGFLFQKGVVSAPSRSSSSGAPTTTATGLPINPITGTIEQEQEPVDMTDEEKEQETEKLFVLFERLEKTGSLSPSQNPLRRAIQEGKLPG